MRLCHLLLPLSHALECAGDAEPLRGWHVRSDPVFEPLYDTRGEGEILLALMSDPRRFVEYRERWWQARGLDPRGPRMTGRALAAQPIVLRVDATARALEAIDLPEPAASPTLLLGPSIRMHDGRSRVIPLLHEIPDPVASIAYGAYVAAPDGSAWRDGERIEDRRSRRRRAHAPGARASRRSPGAPSPCRSMPRSPRRWSTRARASWCACSPRGCAPPADTSAWLSPADRRGPTGAGSCPAPRRSGPRPRSSPSIGRRRIAGAWRSTSTSASAARPASPPATSRTTSRSSGREEHLRGREMSWLRHRAVLRDGRRRSFFLPMLCQHCDSRAVRVGLPGLRHLPQRRGAERAGLQPLRRHALLLATTARTRCAGSTGSSYRGRDPLESAAQPGRDRARRKGVMEKCTFCVQRIRDAKDRGARTRSAPSATARSPPPARRPARREAIVFGDLLDPRTRACAALARDDARPIACWRSSAPSPAVFYLRRRDAAMEPRTRRTSCERDDARDERDVLPAMRQPRPVLLGGARRSARWLRRGRRLGSGPTRSATGMGVAGSAHPVGWGDLHHQLRLLGRDRALRHADLGDPVPVPRALPQQHQPRRRGDDRLRGHDRRAVPAHPPRPRRGSSTGSSRTRTSASSGPTSRRRWCGTCSPSARTSPSALVFFYVGLIPDLAVARDRDTRGLAASGSTRVLSLGWAGTHAAVAALQPLYAALRRASPRRWCISVHSVVSWDFAMGIVPGWHTTIFAPYFVAGAIFSGWRWCSRWCIPMRRASELERRHAPSTTSRSWPRSMLFTSHDRRLRLRRRVLPRRTTAATCTSSASSRTAPSGTTRPATGSWCSATRSCRCRCS